MLVIYFFARENKFFRKENMPLPSLSESSLDGIWMIAKRVVLARCPSKPLSCLIKGFQEIEKRTSMTRYRVDDLPLEDIFEEACKATTESCVQFENPPREEFFVPPGETLSAGARERRHSVSAECYNPPARGEERQAPVVIAKTPEQRAHIEVSVSRNLLFSNLDADQKREILDAMFEKRVPRGTAIIRQGDDGDNFYVVDSGKFSVQVDGVEVVQIGPGGSFGELALMYNTKRSASVIALEDSLVWGVDRQTFRRVNIDLAHQKRLMYEEFLTGIPLLSTLDRSEIGRIADALQPASFAPGDVIFRQGDLGDRFFIIVEGSAIVRQHAASLPSPSAASQQHEVDVSSASEVEVGRLSRGDYFGELALLHSAPRAATIIAESSLRCVALSTADFIRLLGPVMDILRRNEALYKRYEDTIKQHSSDALVH